MTESSWVESYPPFDPSCDPSERESLLLPESLLLLPLLLLSLLALLLAGQSELPELVEPHQELVWVVPPRSSDASPSLLKEDG